LHNDEEIQHKIDLFGAFGTDLTKDQTTSFYKDWQERQIRKAKKFEPEVIINPIEKKKIEMLHAALILDDKQNKKRVSGRVLKQQTIR
jgi:hypothetical protein